MGMVPSGGEVQLQHCIKEHLHLSFQQQCKGPSEALKTTNHLHRILTQLEPFIWQLSSQTHILPGALLSHLKTRGHDAGESPKAQRKSQNMSLGFAFLSFL